MKCPRTAVPALVAWLLLAWAGPAQQPPQDDLRQGLVALNQNDLEAANQYLDRADQETTKLESFLGR